MTHSVQIPIVERKKAPLIRYLRWAAISSLLLVVLGLFIDQGIIVLVAAFIYIVFMVYFGLVELGFVRSYNISGYLNFHRKHIEIVFDEFKDLFYLENIDRLEIKNEGAKGEHYLSPYYLVPKDGTGNFFSFFQNNTQHSYELLFDSRGAKQIKSIIDLWKSDGINITIMNPMGVKVESL